MASFEWPPGLGSGGAGVSSLNALTGDVVLVAGTNITITPSGNNLTIAASGGGGGASTALDNLTTTAINQDLVPASDNFFNLGDPTGTTAWSHLSVHTIVDAGGAPSITPMLRQLYDPFSNIVADWSGVQNFRFNSSVAYQGPTDAVVVVNGFTIDASSTSYVGITSSGSVTSDPTQPLVTASNVVGQVVYLRNENASGDITFKAGGSGIILPNGNVDYVLTPNQTLGLIVDGASKWSPLFESASTGGGGFTPQFFVGPACTANATPVTSSSYATLDTSPTLTFTPSVSGTYKVYSNIMAGNTSGSAGVAGFRVANTSGGATVLAISAAILYSDGTPISDMFQSIFAQSTFTLTSGTSYSFDIQGAIVNGTGSCTLAAGQAAPSGFYIFAELVS